jgi:hypothetical protein
VLGESVGNADPQSGRHTFWWRLTDNFFRRLGWFVLPIVALTLVGVLQAGKTLDLYVASGTLSASPNPFLPEPTSGVDVQFWETSASATSRVINERLDTNSFLTRVAETAGLGELLDNGFLELAVVRSSVWADPDGDSILSVHAEWDDPQVAYELVKATIAEYKEFLSATAASDFAEAETFWTAELKNRQEVLASAEDDLATFLDTLPDDSPDQDLPAASQLAWDRVVAKVEVAQEAVDAAQAEIDNARLQQTQQISQAGRTLSVVDEPTVPDAPQSTLMSRVMTVASWVMLGVVIAAAALVVTTVLDHTVSTPADLLAIDGISLVATVPLVQVTTNRAATRPGPLSHIRTRRSRSDR